MQGTEFILKSGFVFHKCGFHISINNLCSILKEDYDV